MPAAGDTVTVAALHTVTVNANTEPLASLTVNGSVIPRSGVTRTLTVNGDLTVNTGGTLDSTAAAGGTLNINLAGNWTNGGTFTPGTNTVTFNGAAARTIGGTLAAQTFNNLTLSNASGVSVGGSTTDLTLNGSLLITNGTFTAPSGTLQVNGNWTNGGAFTTTGVPLFSAAQPRPLAGAALRLSTTLPSTTARR